MTRTYSGGATAPSAAEVTATSDAAATDRATLAEVRRLREQAKDYAGDAAGAFVQFDKLFAQFPGSNRIPDALLRLGGIHEARGEAENALARLEQAVREHPDAAAAPEAQLHIGVIRRDLGDRAGAIAALTEVAERWPDSKFAPDALFHANRVWISTELDEWETLTALGEVGQTDVSLALNANVQRLLTMDVPPQRLAEVLLDIVNYERKRVWWNDAALAGAKERVLATIRLMEQVAPHERATLRALVDRAALMEGSAPDDAIALLQSVSIQAQAAGDESMYIDATFNLGRALGHRCRGEEARALFDDLAQRKLEPLLTGEVALARALTYWGAGLETCARELSLVAAAERVPDEVRAAALMLRAEAELQARRLEACDATLAEAEALFKGERSVANAAIIREALAASAAQDGGRTADPSAVADPAERARVEPGMQTLDGPPCVEGPIYAWLPSPMTNLCPGVDYYVCGSAHDFDVCWDATCSEQPDTVTYAWTGGVPGGASGSCYRVRPLAGSWGQQYILTLTVDDGRRCTDDDPNHADSSITVAACPTCSAQFDDRKVCVSGCGVDLPMKITNTGCCKMTYTWVVTVESDPNHIIADIDPASGDTGELDPGAAWTHNCHVTTDPNALGGKTATLRLTGTSSCNTTCTDTATVTTVRPNVVLGSLDEPNEVAPGAFVALNFDDDDASDAKKGKPDCDQNDPPNPNDPNDPNNPNTLPIIGEDNLVPLSISLEGAPEEGTVSLNVITHGTGRVRLWTHNKTDPNAVQVTASSWPVQGTSWPVTMWVEGYETSSQVRDVEFRVSLGYKDCGCDDAAFLTVVEANLTLHYGQDPSTDASALGGMPVSQEDQEKHGAFTVANLNDTDNDGGDPNSPNYVPDANDSNVVKNDPSDPNTNYGRNEIDLMKLLIDRPSPAIEGAPLDVVVRGAGSAKFWATSHKGAGTPSGTTTLHYDPNEVSDPNWPRQVWVELPGASSSLRDVEIVSRYAGLQEIDVVKATGIWIGPPDAKHDNNDPNSPFGWPDITDPPRNWLDPNTGYGGFGLRPINAHNGVGNQIAMRWQLEPNGVWLEPNNIYFDLTRNLNHEFYAKVFGAWQAGSETPFEDYREKPNDDPSDDDESGAPSPSGGFFVADAPGIPDPNALPPPVDEFVTRFHMRDFVRVGFTRRPLGSVTAGSRCSGPYAWHARHWLIPSYANPNWWRRSTIETSETAQNDVGPGDGPGQCEHGPPPP